MKKKTKREKPWPVHLPKRKSSAKLVSLDEWDSLSAAKRKEEIAELLAAIDDANEGLRFRFGLSTRHLSEWKNIVKLRNALR
jgi:hypothetical protein